LTYQLYQNDYKRRTNWKPRYIKSDIVENIYYKGSSGIHQQQIQYIFLQEKEVETTKQKRKHEQDGKNPTAGLSHRKAHARASTTKENIRVPISVADISNANLAISFMDGAHRICRRTWYHTVLTIQ
jgi:hypothetical protein